MLRFKGWLPIAFCIFKQIPPTGFGGAFNCGVNLPTIIVSLKQSCSAAASSKVYYIKRNLIQKSKTTLPKRNPGIIVDKSNKSN